MEVEERKSKQTRFNVNVNKLTYSGKSVESRLELPYSTIKENIRLRITKFKEKESGSIFVEHHFGAMLVCYFAVIELTVLNSDKVIKNVKVKIEPVKRVHFLMNSSVKHQDINCREKKLQT